MFIIGRKKTKSKLLVDTYISPEDDELVWDVECSIRDMLRIQKNVVRFDMFMQGALDNKLMKKTMRKKLSKEDEKTLSEMLLNQTSIKVVSQATQEEIDESNKTWWDKVKEKFNKVEEENK